MTALALLADELQHLPVRLEMLGMQPVDGSEPRHDLFWIVGGPSADRSVPPEDASPDLSKRHIGEVRQRSCHLRPADGRYGPLMNSCAECGFRYRDVPRDALSALIRAAAPQYDARLSVSGVRLRTRVDGIAWSPLEYAGHVAQVLAVQRERVSLMQSTAMPELVSMRADHRVLTEQVNEQAPAALSVALTDAAERLAGTLDSLDDGGWSRQGVYVWPQRAERDVDWVARHTVHEAVHHLMDIDRLLGQPA